MSTEVKQSDARVTAIFSVLQSPALCRYLLHHCTFEDTVAFGDTCRISQAAAKQEWTNKTDLLIPAATEGPLTWRLGTHVISALERAVSLALRYCRQLRSISCNATSLTEDAGVTGRTQSLDALLRLVEANRGTLQRLEWAAASPADSALLFTALSRCPRMTTIKAVGVPDGKLMKLFAACPDLCDVTVGHFMLDEFLKTVPFRSLELEDARPGGIAALRLNPRIGSTLQTLTIAGGSTPVMEDVELSSLLAKCTALTSLRTANFTGGMGLKLALPQLTHLTCKPTYLLPSSRLDLPALTSLSLELTSGQIFSPQWLLDHPFPNLTHFTVQVAAFETWYTQQMPAYIAWKQAIADGKCWPHLESFIAKSVIHTEQFFQAITGWKRLRHLHVTPRAGCVDDELLTHILTQLPCLEVLRLDEAPGFRETEHKSSPSWREPIHAPNLRSISLDFRPSTRLLAMLQAPALRTFQMTGRANRLALAEVLVAQPQLHKLVVTESKRAVNKTSSSLGLGTLEAILSQQKAESKAPVELQLQELTVLDPECLAADDDVCSVLACCPHLRSVDVGGQQLGLAGVHAAIVSRPARLHTLHLHHPKYGGYDQRFALQGSHLLLLLRCCPLLRTLTLPVECLQDDKATVEAVHRLPGSSKMNILLTYSKGLQPLLPLKSSS